MGKWVAARVALQNNILFHSQNSYFKTSKRIHLQPAPQKIHVTANYLGPNVRILEIHD